MSSSTVWRRPLEISIPRPPSPLRPLDAIEPLSPLHFNTSPTFTLQYDWNGHHTNGQVSHGLGLSPETYNLGGHSDHFSQRLYVDHRGEAHVNSFRPRQPSSHHDSMNRDASYDISHGHLSKKEHSRRREKTKLHARHRSSIDALATAALGPSSPLAGGSPQSPSVARPATSYTNGYDYRVEGRPAKRHRSEKLPLTEWTKTDTRPATSHIPQLDTTVDDAELLLNFSRVAHFSPPAILPPALPSIEPYNPSRLDYESPSLTKTHLQPLIDETDMDDVEYGQSGDKLPTSPSHQKQDSITLLQNMVIHGSGDVLDEEHLQGFTSDETREDGFQAKQEDKTFLFAIPPDQAMPYPSASMTYESSSVIDTPDGAAEISVPSTDETATLVQRKKPRRVKTVVQSTCCDICKLLQRADAAAGEESIDFWISCNACKEWFHASCAGFRNRSEAESVDKFVCSKCTPIHGKTTFRRKSSRARTAIDYAELNQGNVKSSTEVYEHPHVRRIKNGSYQFVPDDFARMRPEYVTSDYFGKTDGMKRPIVIPAAWNSRPGVREGSSLSVGENVDLGDGDDESDEFEEDEVVDCGQDLLDMVMPEGLTVRKVSELYGPDQPVEIIDVKAQDSGGKGWNMERWANYYESTEENKVVRNVISLEVSQSRLGRLIRRPKVVRDLDLQDDVWPAELQAISDYPKVQFYCLMSVSDCYTDFHIDFGGSSVYYHILKGKKTFLFIPPDDRNLSKYKDWCNSTTQATDFLGNLTGECSRVDLSEGDTMLIPAGWIHAVWTPEDSLVIGGNFLTHMHYPLQLKVANIERDTNVSMKFRYPFFQKIMWYTAIKYIEDDPVPEEIANGFAVDDDFVFPRTHPVWYEFEDNDQEAGDWEYNSRFYPKPEMEGLRALRDYLYRTALIASDYPVEGVKVDAAKRVKRSIPKGHGEPLELMAAFDVWCVWKLGHMTLAEWRESDQKIQLKPVEVGDKAKLPNQRTPGERTSSRIAKQAAVASVVPKAESEPLPSEATKAPTPEAIDSSVVVTSPSTKQAGLGPKRVACEPCRKRRIRCRHKEQADSLSSPPAQNDHQRSFSNMSAEGPMNGLSQVVLSSSGLTDALADGQVDSLASPEYSPLEVTEEKANDLMAAMIVQTPGFINKKGRMKACEECRKSKRRCIHDEFGRVDPAKAAEPSKPRGSSNTKRPSHLIDDSQDPSPKKQRLEYDLPPLDTSAIPNGHFLSESAIDDSANIDPALLTDSSQPIPGNALKLAQSGADAIKQPQYIGDSPSALAAKPSTPSPTNGTFDEERSDELVNVPIKCEDGTSILETPEARSGASEPSRLASTPVSRGVTEVETSIEPTGGKGSGQSSSTPASRQSSRQMKRVDRYIPDAPLHTPKPISKPDDRRASSSGASAQTAGTGKSRRSSSQLSSTTGKTSAGPATLNGKAHSPVPTSRPGSQARTSLGDIDADPESAALIRVMQEEEFGLRRRSTRA